MTITHFCTAPDKPTMLSLLATYSGTYGGKSRPLLVTQQDGSKSLDQSFCDDSNGSGIPIVDAQSKPVAGYFWNVVLDALDQTMPGLTGAGHGPADAFTLVYGTKPSTPQRVFA
jgi:hypothetical protein